MSFKSFSRSQGAPSAGKPGDKTKTAAVDETGPQPAKKQDGAAPAQKS